MNNEINGLIEKEPKFKEIKIEIILEKKKNHYENLCRTIIWQQLAGKVAQKIWIRFEEKHEQDITPEKTLSLSFEELKSIGLSKQKTSYIIDLAQKFAEYLSKLNFEEMNDEEIIEELIEVKGVGRWSAEMFLIFSLARKDVFAVDDYGLKKAVQKFYSLKELPNRKEMKELSEKWKPHRTTASLLLWKSLE